MNTAELLKYFAAEKQAALLITALAVVGTALGLYLRVNGSAFRQMAWVLFAVAAVQVAIGAGLLIRTGPQVQALVEGLAQEPAQTLQSERLRMDKVNASWRMIKSGEVIAIAAGVLLILVGASRGPAWQAVGMGLLLEGAVLLVFDTFAQHRSLRYARWLAQPVGS